MTYHPLFTTQEVFCITLGCTRTPRSIINQFGLTEYDKLEWTMKVENGELIIQVKPQKGEVR